MRTLKDKREWSKEKLVDWGRHVEVEGLDGIVKLTDKQLKNKKDSIKRKGRKNVEDFVLPCLKELRREARLKSPTLMPTGSAVPEEGIEQLDDFRCLIEWPLLEAKAKLSNLHLYYEMFGEHPTDDDDDDGNPLLAGELRIKANRKQRVSIASRHVTVQPTSTGKSQKTTITERGDRHIDAPPPLSMKLFAHRLCWTAFIGSFLLDFSFFGSLFFFFDWSMSSF